MYATEPVYTRGRHDGRATFEIAAFVLPLTKAATAGRLTKAEALTKLRNAKFFQTGAGRVAFQRLEALASYLARLSTTKMCFVAGTKVLTDRGPVNIEDIRAGDMVLSRDPETWRQEYRRVVETVDTHPTTLYHVRFAALGRHGREPAGDASDDHRLVCTGEHPFFVINRSEPGFVPAKELRIGDHLSLADGGRTEVAAFDIEHAPAGETFTTYNFEVESFHTYFAGTSAVWVHNRGNACQRIFALIDRRARTLGKAHEAELAELRFQALLETRGHVLGRKVAIADDVWSTAALENGNAMVADYAAGRMGLANYPSVNRWNNEFFKDILKGDVDVHHSVEKFVSRTLGIPESALNDCPGIVMKARGPAVPHHRGPMADDGLAGTLNSKLINITDRQALVNELERTYKSKPEWEKYWDLARDWLRSRPEVSDLTIGN